MNTRKIIVFSGFIVVVLLTLSVVSAKNNYMDESTFCTEVFGGVYNPTNNLCYNVKVSTEMCPDGYATYNMFEPIAYTPLHGAQFSLALTEIEYTCGYTGSSAALPLDKKGVAKITMMPVKSYLGGTIKIEGKGAPSFLRLKANGVIYKLPVVPGSIKQLDDGTFIAEFYTIDPFTSQPLVAPGEYIAELFGVNGPAGGGFSITILR